MANSPFPTEHLAARLHPSQINTIKPLITNSMFWRPTYLAQSAWLEHVPFAFWIVEAHRPRVIVELGTHYGVSYFSFCQAVDRLGLDTQCFAIDTWKGDEHAGFYSEDVFTAVREHNDEQYSTFSRLVRSTFKEAAEHFLPSSIDLLHIDGLHTFEGVSEDFNTWLPKLSDDAVVIFHDTNVRERGFGVSTFFETIKGKYPHFEFIHGHGLGVISIGKGGRSPVKALLSASEDPALRHMVCDIFARLGRGVADTLALRKAAKRIDHLQIHSNRSQELIRKLESQIEAARLEKQEAEHSLAAKNAEIASLEKAIQDYARMLDLRFFELAKLTDNLEREREAVLQAKAETSVHLTAKANIEQAHKTLVTKHRELEQRHAELGTRRDELKQSREALANEHGELKHSHNALEKEHNELKNSYNALVKKHEEVRESRSALAKNHSGLEQSRAALSKERDELVRYARKLERDHLALLESTTWRALEPARVMLRTLRRKRRPPAFVPRL